MTRGLLTGDSLPPRGSRSTETGWASHGTAGRVSSGINGAVAFGTHRPYSRSVTGLARRAWTETRVWHSARREAAIVGFGIGLGVAVSLLHRVSLVRMLVISVVGAAAIAAIVPMVAFLLSVVPMPYRVIIERLDAIEARAGGDADDGPTVALHRAGGVEDATEQIVGES
jgi:hypothetical protein